MAEPQELRMLNGRYKIGEKLGQGGLASVYRVEDTKTGQTFAAKIINSSPLIDRLGGHVLKVSENASKIDHRNVVRIHDFGSEGMQAYVVMDLLQGRTLRQVLLDKGALPWNHAKPVFIQLCDGLGAIHDAGIVHRDLKPANIVLSENPSGMEVKILDYIYGRMGNSDFVERNIFFGTPSYSSPEQILHSNDFDKRSDIYTLGLIMYEALSGVLPFKSNDVLEELAGRLHELPARLMDVKKGIKAGVDEMVMRALCSEPERRFQSAGELRDAIERII